MTDTLAPDATYDGWPLRILSVDNLLQQQGPVYYVYPHEGECINGRWKFHGGKIMDKSTEIDCPDKPLLIDQSSASAFKAVWNAINDKNKEKTRGFLESRGMTVWMFEEIIWPNVSFNRR